MIKALDLDELIWFLTDSENSEEETYDLLEEKYHIGMDDFENIISDLLPLIEVGRSPLTGTLFKGFSNNEDAWLCKMEVKLDDTVR